MKTMMPVFCLAICCSCTKIPVRDLPYIPGGAAPDPASQPSAEAKAVESGETGSMQETSPLFGDDLEFLNQHLEIMVLKDKSGQALVAVSHALQGRVMTSTLDGPTGLSLGWINKELVASGETLEHFNPYGGEDRFWLGPEGGQFALFFTKGTPFDLEHWYTPPAIDTEPFEIVGYNETRVLFHRTMSLENYSGTPFEIQVDREISLLTSEAVETHLSTAPGDSIKMVAYHSKNTITNTGKTPWQKETGLVSIWILSMYNPSPETTVVIPFIPGDELGPIVNDTYFGKVPADRLVVKGNVLFFSADGTYRSKIGLSPQRATPLAGSYDALNRILTIVHYDKPEGATDYVNSMWELQDRPYGGDVINSYNDGPPAPGAKALGPFYELETSSPAAALEPGDSLTHTHRTFHFTGSHEDLDAIARATLTVGLDDIEKALQ